MVKAKQAQTPQRTLEAVFYQETGVELVWTRTEVCSLNSVSWK